MLKVAGQPRSVWAWVLSGTALFLITAALWIASPIRKLDYAISDSFFELGKAREGSSNVVLVLIEDSSVQKYGRWPWSRTVLADLVRKISSQNPKVIGLDILLSEPQAVDADRELSQSIAAAGNVVLVDKISGSPQGDLWIEPLPMFSRNAAGIGHAQVLLDSDGVCRRFPLRELTLQGPRLAFALEVASKIDERRARQFSMHYETAADTGTSNFQVVSPSLAAIHFRKPRKDQEPFNTIAAADVLEGKAAIDLRNKAVLVGFGTSEISDRLVTPISGLMPSPGVEIHAHILDAILNGRSLKNVLWPLQFALLGALCLGAAWAMFRFPGWVGIFVLAVTSVGTYVIAFAIFNRLHLLLHLGPAACALALAAPLTQVVQLVLADRAVTQRLADLEKYAASHSTIARVSASRPFRGSKAQSTRLGRKLQAMELLQNQLAAAYDFEHLLLETTGESIAVFGSGGQLLFANRALKVHWHTICGNETVTLESMQAWLDSGGWKSVSLADPISQEAEIRTDNGLWNVQAIPLPRSAKAPTEAVMFVLTDLKNKLERDQARAEALGFVTHELRTPLVAIQGCAELMMRYPDSLGARSAPGTIFRESRRLVTLISSYLDVLRLDSGARPLRVERCDVNAILDQLLFLLRPLADTKGIRLSKQNRLNHIQADLPLLTGAVLNLLSNAIKYGSENSEIRIVGQEEDGAAVLSVWNSGLPIPSGSASRLFEPFYRGEPEVGGREMQSEEMKGWGLGLAFVQRIAQKHGATIDVRSDATQGTRFTLRFPCTLAKETEAIIQ